MFHGSASRVEVRFDDGLWRYCLGSAMGRDGEALTEREARWVLAQWFTREPGRGELRRFAATELRVEARTDDGLVERVLALLEMRAVRLWRLPRMGIAEAFEVAEAEEAEPLVAESEDETHWFHVVVVDEEDRPMAGVRYRIELTDGRVREGKTDANGGVYYDGMPAGECNFLLVEYDEEMWSPAS
ncbi:hypothetical protein [Paraliomyxa miuraensis]|uniref:hypothetical protein n=1 Tax=Paraliomyxa miuraensis TaxID=376150 RepID=UPI00225BE246|nr:hypothetical protein [Paraliomyxa miuraensis]MCX4241749.1 hypothetical protein [Paraliomyxa miuraensis]